MVPTIVRGQHASAEEVKQSVSLVLDAPTSLRGAGAVLLLLLNVERHWTTIRLWMMRIGLAALTRPLDAADDWVWLIDHSVQIGRCKCLVILGIRLCDYPWGRALTFVDVVPVAVVPMESSTKETVNMALEDATQRTGAPRIIVNDHGGDVHGGVMLFQKRHSETVEVYDVKHKAACLLRARLEGDDLWKSFCSKVGQCKFALQQTELAPLTPPSQRSKARFMNLDTLVEWGTKTSALLENPAGLPETMSTARLEDKLGWLREFREPLAEWSECLGVIDQTLELTRTDGIRAETADILRRQVLTSTPGAGKLATQLIDFVAEQSSVASLNERLPASTEVLESCFGKLKYLEHEQSKSGFTGLVLTVGAMVGQLTAETVANALERCRVKDVLYWCHKMLGPTIQSQRKLAYAQHPAQQN